LKGATDGGLNIPHSVNRFVGYDTDGKKLKAETLRSYIFGGHVANHMSELEEEDPESYQTHYSRFIKAGLNSENLEETYKKVHAAIRANPDATLSQKKKPATQKRFGQTRLTYEQRRKAASEKKASLVAAKGADADDDEEDEQ